MDKEAPTRDGRTMSELDCPTGTYLLDTTAGIAASQRMTDEQRRDHIIEREADIVAYRNAMVMLSARYVELEVALNEANAEKKKLREDNRGWNTECDRRLTELRRDLMNRIELHQHALDRLGLTTATICAIDEASDEDEVDRILKPYLAKKRGRK